MTVGIRDIHFNNNPLGGSTFEITSLRARKQSVPHYYKLSTNNELKGV